MASMIIKSVDITGSRNKMKAQYLIPLLGLACLQAQAVKVIEKTVDERTKIADENKYLYVKINVGATFASHFWRANTYCGTPTERCGLDKDTKVNVSSKSGIAAGQRINQSYSGELEYAYLPLKYTFEQGTAYKQPSDYSTHDDDGNARIDAIFVNGLYESNYFSTDYHPYIGAGLGMLYNKLSTRTDYSTKASDKNNDSGLAIQLKLGYNHDLSEGFTWGLEYGYIRGIQDTEIKITKANGKIYTYQDTYKTQFISLHTAMRF
jgi:hypothetical protein